VIPPLRRRCPRCGHRDWTERFAVTGDPGSRLLVCPSCGHQFEPAARPWLR